MRGIKPIPEILREYYKYDEITGELYFVKAPGRGGLRLDPLKPRLFVTNKGYLQLCFRFKTYKVHRVVWFLATGQQPDIIDHINGIKSDNRLCNLRSVTYDENLANSYKHRAGRTLGVGYDKAHKLWRVRIPTRYLNGNHTNKLGYFKTEQEAIDALNEYYKTLVTSAA